MSEARAEAVEIAATKKMPSDVWGLLLLEEVDAGDVDSAAEDLTYWLSISSAEDLENNSANRVNSLRLVDKLLRFDAMPGAKSHPLTPKIRADGQALANEAYSVLTSEMQAGVNRMAREAG